MEQAKIDRINELAKKAKTPEGLTDEEQLERKELHMEYLLAIRTNLEAQLESTVIVDEHGNRRKVQKKSDRDKKEH